MRGSLGYGKTFVGLDNGRLREDSVKDIGACSTGSPRSPASTPSACVVVGGSYGGYMASPSRRCYSDRIAGAVDVVGIANFVTFLENTESYRRDLRRVEYGDERDPAMRAFLTSISPVTNAANDQEAAARRAGPQRPARAVHRIRADRRDGQARTARRSGIVLADNEGHGFARKDNADYFFLSMVEFIATTHRDASCDDTGPHSIRSPARLHLLEQVHELPRDRQFLRPALEQHELALGILAQHAGDGVEVDDGAAMDLPELLGIELGQQVLERRADQRLADCAITTRVYLVSDWKYTTSPTAISLTCLPTAALIHLMPRRAAARRRAQLREQRGQVGGRRRELSSACRSIVCASRSLSTGFSR